MRVSLRHSAWEEQERRRLSAGLVDVSERRFRRRPAGKSPEIYLLSDRASDVAERYKIRTIKVSGDS